MKLQSAAKVVLSSTETSQAPRHSMTQASTK